MTYHVSTRKIQFELLSTNSLDGVLLGVSPQLSASQSQASPRSPWGHHQGNDLRNGWLISGQFLIDVGSVRSSISYSMT